METQIDELTKLLRELQIQNTSIKRSLDDNLTTLLDLGAWRPTIDTKVDELHSSVRNLQVKVDELAARPPPQASGERVFEFEEVDLTKSAAAHLAASSAAATSGPLGHGNTPTHRGPGHGVVTTYVPTPVTGAQHPQLPLLDALTRLQLNQAIPPMEFPKFDGMHPNLWKKNCESYFEVYAVPSNVWVKMAVMNFTGSAAFWSQSVEAILNRCTWPELCATICSRFERDQQSHLDRQFLHLKQTSTVTAYIEKYDELVHHILAHDPCFSQHMIISRFIDGLREDIRAVVILHRPPTLDSACSLALLQEEVLLDFVPQESKKSDSSWSSKTATVKHTNVSVGNTSLHKAPSVPTLANSKASDLAKPSYVEEKMQSIKNYRRAKGLCFKCGDKWNPTHKCSTTVSLNLVEEL
jgi:hypothetical protein